MATTITIPAGLSDDEIVAFIRNEIYKRGGDPDTAKLTDIKGFGNQWSSGKPVDCKIKFGD